MSEPAAIGTALNWWLPRRVDPLNSGWFYVQEDQPKFVVSMRYFDDSNQTWWAFTRQGLVPNESFKKWLVIPGISDHQGTHHDGYRVNPVNEAQ